MRAALRAGWLFVLFVVLSQGLNGALTYVGFKAFGYQPSDGWVARGFWIAETCGFVAVMLVTAVMARLTRRRTREFGLPLD